MENFTMFVDEVIEEQLHVLIDTNLLLTYHRYHNSKKTHDRSHLKMQHNNYLPDCKKWLILIRFTIVTEDTQTHSFFFFKNSTLT